MSDAPFARTVVLLNPAGASGAAGRRWRQVAGLAAEVLPGLSVIESRAPGELRARARDAARTGEPVLLLAAGGDGTSHEVINGVIDAGPTAATVGWIPIGSGNDLARSVGVPLDAARAIRWYRRARTARIDVGTVRFQDTTRVFGNSFTVGLSTDVLQIVRHGRRMGGLSYAVGTVRALARQEPFDLDLDIDGAPTRVAGARLLSVTNGATFGAGMRVTPGARLDDGRLDLVWIAGTSRLATLLVFPRIYWGGHLEHRAVRTVRLGRLTIRSPAIHAVEMDGELIPATGPVELGVLPGALRIATGGGE